VSGIELKTSRSVARNSDHYTTEAVTVSIHCVLMGQNVSTLVFYVVVTMRLVGDASAIPTLRRGPSQGRDVRVLRLSKRLQIISDERKPLKGERIGQRHKKTSKKIPTNAEQLGVATVVLSRRANQESANSHTNVLIAMWGLLPGSHNLSAVFFFELQWFTCICVTSPLNPLRLHEMQVQPLSIRLEQRFAKHFTQIKRGQHSPFK
jgi:hypothetical protein